MGMTLKELLTKGEGTLSAQEAKTLAAQCRMDVETLYTLLEERGIKIIEDEADADVNLDVDSIIAEVENAENNSDELGLGMEDEEEAAEENPADLKAAMDELLDDPVKNYLKQIGQIPLLSAEQEVDLSKRIHSGAEAAHILQADRQKYGAPEYIKKKNFYEAIVITYTAAINFAHRYAAKAREMAASCPDPVRKAELLQIAANCDRVPERGATNF